MVAYSSRFRLHEAGVKKDKLMRLVNSGLMGAWRRISRGKMHCKSGGSLIRLAREAVANSTLLQTQLVGEKPRT